jgi:hypothetical protein
MKKLLGVINAILGIWLLICPWLLGYAGTAARWTDLGGGILILTFSIITLALKTGTPSPNWPFISKMVVAAGLMVSAVGFTGQLSPVIRWNDAIAGLLVALVSLVASQIVEGRKTFAYTKDGGLLLEMVSITYKDGIIVVKGKSFGTMPMLMHMRPLDLWNILGLVPMNVILRFPLLLLTGWRKNRETSKAAVATK